MASLASILDAFGSMEYPRGADQWAHEALMDTPHPMPGHTCCGLCSLGRMLSSALERRSERTD